MWAVLIPFPSKRNGSLFFVLTRRKFFLRLSMTSWGQFYVMERFCDVLKGHKLSIKLQPWLTFFWKSFCPCFYGISCDQICKLLKSTFSTLYNLKGGICALTKNCISFCFCFRIASQSYHKIISFFARFYDNNIVLIINFLVGLIRFWAWRLQSAKILLLASKCKIIFVTLWKW